MFIGCDIIDLAEILLKNGYCDINENITGGMTPIMFAARDSTEEMVTYLLNQGADLTRTSDAGETVYDYASNKNRVVIELFSARETQDR